jgi:hypothetical protein
MSKFYYCLFTTLLLSCKALLAQQSIVVSGYVKDGISNTPLPGAAIYAPSLQKGTVTDNNGHYSIVLPSDTLPLVFSYTGYNPQKKFLHLKQDTKINIALAIVELEEVVIRAHTLLSKVESTQMSLEKISASEAKVLPAMGGEVDIIKSIQLKPGVQSGGEGSSGLFVRGGSPDQNLMLLDEAPIYNPSHLFGFFSVFNADAIEDVNLYKGGFPSQYGGRLSSVVDVSSRDGNRHKFSGSGGIGFVASRITLEGPIKKDKSSFIFSARRTYVDTFTDKLNKKLENKTDYDPIPDYYFYDLNAKITFSPSPKDDISISGYMGQDAFELVRNKHSRFNINFDWGNKAATVQWRRRIKNNLYSSLSYVHSGYDYLIRHSFDLYSFRVGSSIATNTLKYDIDYSANPKHTVKAGSAITYHSFSVARASAMSNGDEPPFFAGRNFYGGEFGAYISDEYELSNRLKLNGGARISGFTQKEVTYAALEPRASVRYLLSEVTSVKASYSRMNQYLHLVSSSGASLPIDIWYPTTKAVKPEKSDQFAASFSTLLFKKKLLLSNEVYYKSLSNQIDYRDGANLVVNNNLEDEFVYGIGRSYGNEVYLEKKEGKTTGWIGYTLSWSWRQFDDINGGKRFYPRHDRRHDLSLVLMHKLSKHFLLSGSWVYSSGNAISLPLGRMQINDVPGKYGSSAPMAIYPKYDGRNNYRLDAYHRLDLGLVVKLNPRWGESDFTFSIYNTYNRMNPYFIYFERVTEHPDGTGNLTGFKAKQVSLFPVIPSITYNFKF